MNKVEEAIENHWGSRCPNFNSYCHICQAWKEYDDINIATSKTCTTDQHEHGYFCCKCDKKLSFDTNKKFYCSICD